MNGLRFTPLRSTLLLSENAGPSSFSLIAARTLLRRRRASIKLGVVQRYQAPVHHFNPAIEDDLPKPTEYCPLTRELLAMLLEPDVPAPAYDLALVKRTLLSVGVAALRNDLPGAGLVHDFLGDVLSPAQLSQVLADIRSGELTARQLTSA